VEEGDQRKEHCKKERVEKAAAERRKGGPLHRSHQQRRKVLDAADPDLKRQLEQRKV